MFPEDFYEFKNYHGKPFEHLDYSELKNLVARKKQMVLDKRSELSKKSQMLDDLSK